MIHPAKFVFRRIADHQKLFLKVVAGLFVVKLLSMALPIFVGAGVDIISSSSAGRVDPKLTRIFSVLTEFFSVQSQHSSLLLVVIILLFLSVLLLFVSPWQQKQQTRFVQEIVFDLTCHWFQTIFQKDLLFFKEKNAARTSNVLSRGIHGHEKLLNQWINVLLPVFIELALATAILIQIAGFIAVIFVFCSVLAQSLITLYVIRSRRPLVSELNDIEDESAEQTQDILSKGLIFQLYRGAAHAERILGRVYRKYADQCVRISSSGAHLSWLPFHFQNLGSMAALLLGFQLVQNEGQSLGQVLVLISLFNRFSSAASECVGSLRILDQFQLDVEQAHKLLCYDNFFRPGHQIATLESVFLAAGTWNRKGIALQIPENIEFKMGDQVALVGPSGSGKSTLLEIFAGLDPDSREAVAWNRFPLSSLGSDEQLRFLRYTPQEPMIFSGTFSANCFQSSLTGCQLAQDLQIDHLLDEKRQQITSSSLSGGEAKRVALIRTLTSPAGLYLMDEPTAGLNELMRISAWNVIQERTKSAILFAVTHDEAELARFNKVLSVENGRVQVLKWSEAPAPVHPVPAASQF